MLRLWLTDLPAATPQAIIVLEAAAVVPLHRREAVENVPLYIDYQLEKQDVQSISTDDGT
jgi:hypothetical protein